MGAKGALYWRRELSVIYPSKLGVFPKNPYKS
jgi:hypothetical protein